MLYTRPILLSFVKAARLQISKKGQMHWPAMTSAGLYGHQVRQPRNLMLQVGEAK
jgi:hypothetical protein